MAPTTVRQPINFDVYIEERVDRFSGRNWVFDYIHKWLALPEGNRFFLLTGEPGSGKTAIAARLSQFSSGSAAPPANCQKFSPGFLSAIHFCSVRAGTWIDPISFARSFALQLAQANPRFAQALATAGDRSVNIQVTGKASAYLPVIDLLHNYFDISATDDERKRREKVAGRITILDRSLEDALPYFFSLLGIVEGDDPLAQTDGQIKKRRTLDAIKRILLRESLNQALMVIFEDLHWIDEQTQDFLNLLADSIGTAKILLLVNYRPEYSHSWNSKTYYTQLRLDPLGKESAEEMLSALLGDGRDLLRLKRLIIERTEATPFFMEEIVQSLFEDGVLVRNGAVKLARSMNAVKVPPTVQAVLASRIDRLPTDEKEFLQTLAVLGREFSFTLVRRVTLKPDDELERTFSRLQAEEFIYEQLAAGDVEYTFKHALTQAVAYNALLIERRKLFHERAGIALESTFAGQLDDHLDELAHHYSRSDNVSKAVEYLGRAGQQAAQRSAYADAINSLMTAIDLLQKLPDSPERIRRELLVQLAVGPALIPVKGYAAPEVERAYTRARELCERLGDPPELFPALLGLWIMHLLRGEVRMSYELAEQLLRLAESAQDRALLNQAQHAFGSTSFWMGKFLAAREHLENRDRPLRS